MLIPNPKRARYEDGVYPLPEAPQLLLPDAFSTVSGGIASLLPKFALAGDGMHADVRFLQGASLPEDAYTIRCDATGAAVTARDGNAAVYAASALSQLLHAKNGVAIPYCEITDAPRFAWRGMHFDVARHFFPMETLRKIVDIMAVYRLNRLHLHISDDQGFRVESERLPRLHEIGSMRDSSAVKLGEGERQDGKPHGGYYTKTEMRAFIGYAAERGITVVPEIDLPGHTNALIASYPFLACFPKATKVVTEYGIKPFSHHILCAGEPKVYEFLYALFEELTELFPSEYVHIGGDEAGKDNWKKCEKCQRVMREQGIKTERELQGYMLEKVRAFLAAKGKRVIIWNDALSRFTKPDEIVQHWTPRSMEGDARTVRHINAGGQAIMSGFRHLYLDYPYAMTPLRKVYEYDPIPKGVTPEHRGNILGIECTLWTEWIADEQKLFFDLLPRLAAAAELAWSMPESRDYSDFTRRLQSHYALYDEMALPYAKGKECSGGVLSRLKTVRAFFYKDANTELR